MTQGHGSVFAHAQPTPTQRISLDDELRVALPEEVATWAARVRRAVGAPEAGPRREELDDIEEWQSRVSGGGLISFLHYITVSSRGERGDGLADRVFVYVCDRAGAAASSVVLNFGSGAMLRLSREAWARLGEDAELADPQCLRHYRFWNHWHREPSDRRLWVYTQGYAIGPMERDERKQLWRWSGGEMELLLRDWPG